MFRHFLALANDDRAQDIVEYALLVALIALGCVACLKRLSTEINLMFNSISHDLNTAI